MTKLPRIGATDAIQTVESLKHELDETMRFARRDAEKDSRSVRTWSYVRLVVAALASTLVVKLGADVATMVVTTVTCAAWAIIATINDWGTRGHALQMFTPDQALKLHDAQVATVGAAAEAVVASLATTDVDVDD